MRSQKKIKSLGMGCRKKKKNGKTGMEIRAGTRPPPPLPSRAKGSTSDVTLSNKVLDAKIYFRIRYCGLTKPPRHTDACFALHKTTYGVRSHNSSELRTWSLGLSMLISGSFNICQFWFESTTTHEKQEHSSEKRVSSRSGNLASFPHTNEPRKRSSQSSPHSKLK
jgi:hypothetical protein